MTPSSLHHMQRQPVERKFEMDVVFVSSLVVGVIVLLMVIVVARATYFIVTPTKRYIIERLGKYQWTAGPGLHFRIPFIDRIAAKMNMPLNHINIEADCKSSDNVYSKVHLTIQYQPKPGREADANYLIQDEAGQMKAIVLDAVRTQVSSMPFEELYSHKDAVAQAARQHVVPAIEAFGWYVANVLVTDIIQDASVRAALQEVRTQALLRQAMESKGEANKILMVKNAEAESETKKLQGEGIAREQKAIADGIKERIELLQEATGSDPTAVMRVLLLTQYFDTQKAIGIGAGSRVLFLPSGPDGVDSLMSQIVKALQTGVETT